jgi:hypothetical protein
MWKAFSRLKSLFKIGAKNEKK